MDRRQSSFVGFVLAGLLGLGAVATAWACTPHASLGVNPARGLAGAEVVVEGRDFGPYPVEIRWNSVTGPKLVEPDPNGESFSVKAKIPDDAAKGVYYIVAVQYVPNTPGHHLNVNGLQRAVFEVTSQRQSANPSGDGGDGAEQGQPGSVSANADAGEEDSTTAVAPAVSPAAAPAVSPGAGAAAAPGVVPTASGTGAQPSSDDAARPASERGQSPPAVRGATVNADPGTAATGTGSSLRVASGDLWSGFAAGAKPSLAGNDDYRDAGRGSPVLVVGSALFVIGLATLLGGFAMTELNRRKAQASPSSGS